MRYNFQDRNRILQILQQIVDITNKLSIKSVDPIEKLHDWSFFLRRAEKRTCRSSSRRVKRRDGIVEERRALWRVKWCAICSYSVFFFGRYCNVFSCSRVLKIWSEGGERSVEFSCEMQVSWAGRHQAKPSRASKSQPERLLPAQIRIAQPNSLLQFVLFFSFIQFSVFFF